MITCLTSISFNMKADIQRQTALDGTPIDTTGEWVTRQDPDSGEIIRVWQTTVLDDPLTPLVDESVTLESFQCTARGIIDGGVRVAGTTERFGEMYENVDYVKMTFPASVTISKRDRITNIRGPKGNVIWREEEEPSAPPTVFNVNGVTPIIDPLGNHIQNFALLARAEIQ